MSPKVESIVPTLTKPTSRRDMEAKRNGVLARAPSGAVYRVAPVNLQRHALSGGLPQKLRQIAMQGSRGVNRLFQGEDGEISEEGSAVRGYLDRLVLAVLRHNEPKYTEDDLGSGSLDDDPVLPPADYKWLLEIAMQEAEYDAEGRRLWGVEPLDRWTLFRHFHDCDPSCEGCNGVRSAISDAL